MDFNTIKEVCVEYCENIYALGCNYLNYHNNLELVNIMLELDILEDKVRSCNDINKLFDYKKFLESIMNRIEVIINA